MTDQNVNVWKIWCDASFVPHRSQKMQRVRGAAWGAFIQDPDGACCDYAGILQDCFSSTDAELWAVLKSLQQVPDQSAVVVMCDCSNVVVGVQNALDTDLEELAKDPLLPGVPKFMRRNSAVIQHLQRECARLQSLRMQWVKGHSGDFGNSRADWLAGNQLKIQKTPFVYDGDALHADREETTSPSGRSCDGTALFWRSYIPPIQELLQSQFHVLLKGDSRKVTKYLHETGVLDVSQPYNKKVKDGLPNACQLAGVAKLLQIPQGKKVVQQKNLERQSVKAKRRKKNKKTPSNNLATPKRKADKTLCDALLQRIEQGESVHWKSLTAAPHAFIHALEQKRLITQGAAHQIIRARETAFNAKAAAKFLQTTTPRIRRLDADGRLPSTFTRYGHQRWLREDLQNALPLMSEWTLADQRARAAVRLERTRMTASSATVCG